jgi:hypothetical protein
VCLTVLGFLGMSVSPALSQTDPSGLVYRIGNDRGGPLGPRMKVIDNLKNSGQPVEIVGRVCISSCTLFLGLDNVCVSARTSFGFHGPSSSGVPLPTETQKYWSDRVATYYPDNIRTWFLKDVQYEIEKIYWISGKEMIRYGIKEC